MYRATRLSLSILGLAALFLALPATAQNADGPRAASLTDSATRSVSGTPVTYKGGPTVFQAPNQVGGFLSDSDCVLCSGGQLAIADDFDAGPGFVVSDITVWGGTYPDNLAITDDFTVIFHTDTDGLPGASFSTQANLTPACKQDTGVDFFGVDEYVYRIELPVPVAMGAGFSWVEIFNNSAGYTTSWLWESGDLDATEGRFEAALANETPGASWAVTGWGGAGMAFALNAGTTYCTDGGDPTVPDVDIEYLGSTADPERGDFVFVRAQGTNNKNVPVRTRVYTEVLYPNGTTRRYSVGSANFPALTSLQLQKVKRIKFPIPANAPSGTYTVTLYIADDLAAGGEVYDTDTFTFELGPLDPFKTDSGAEAGPNPFTTETTIRYELSADAEVDLRVFDVTGREVASLASGVQSAGVQSAVFAAGDLPGGVYVWRLAIGGEVTTGRVTLAR